MAPEFSIPLGILEDAYDANDPELQLMSSSLIEFPASIDPNEILAVGDELAVVYGDRAVILEATNSASTNLENIGVKPTPSPFPSGFFSSGTNFPSGSYVYNVRKMYVHSFRVDTAHDYLLMDTLDETGDLLAEGIEDLQVAFTEAKTDPSEEASLIQKLEDNTLSQKTLTLARVVLVSKSPTKDPYSNSFPRIQALDHKPVGADQYRRRVLETVVNLRNF
jgi:hypothetical protein